MNGKTVYIKSEYACSPPSVYHTDPDCPRLKGESREKELDKLFEDLRECKLCSGTVEWSGGKGEGHLESLKEAAERGEI